MSSFKPSIIFSACLHVLLVSSMVSTGRPGHGLIGYGISMYNPLCAFSCRDVLSSSMLNCSESVSMSSMGIDMGSDTSPDCYATDDAFLESLAYCLSTHCQDVSVWVLEKYWVMNVAGTSINQPMPKATYQQTIANMTTKPTDTLVIGEDLNKTMIVSYEDYEKSYNAQSAFERMEIKHETYGYVMPRFPRLASRADWSLPCVASCCLSVDPLYQLPSHSYDSFLFHRCWPPNSMLGSLTRPYGVIITKRRSLVSSICQRAAKHSSSSI